MRRDLPAPFRALLALALLAAPLTAAAGAQTMRQLDESPTPRIVNGVETTVFPSVVALLSSNGISYCTGTLIGCQTVITAAHCVCDTDGSDCQALTPSAGEKIFVQHAGLFDIASIDVPISYVFGVEDDIAVLTLTTPVTGIAGSPVNDEQSPGTGLTGTIVGYGLTVGPFQAATADTGVKRTGLVTTASCPSGIPEPNHVCWDFEDPLGTPGLDSNTCNGDSGGPLFLDFGTGLVLSGVTSGGFSATCMPSDSAFDTNVFQQLGYITTEAGADLSTLACGGLGPVRTEDVASESGDLSALNTKDTWTVDVPAGQQSLRVTLNGSEETGNDFDLWVKLGSEPASADDALCASENGGNFEVCPFDPPAAGTYYAVAVRISGSGHYQLTTTVLGPLFADGFETGDASAWAP